MVLSGPADFRDEIDPFEKGAKGSDNASGADERRDCNSKNSAS